MTDIKLETGQTVHIEDGIARVQPKGAPHHYKLTARHVQGGLLDVRCAEYGEAIAFLGQLERLGYTMHALSRVEGK
jgi:hypothetical protein